MSINQDIHPIETFLSIKSVLNDIKSGHGNLLGYMVNNKEIDDYETNEEEEELINALKEAEKQLSTYKSFFLWRMG